jgi:hypothetical protein
MKLRVAVGMRRALLGLAVGLQAEPQHAQVLRHRLMADAMAGLAQRSGQRPHALGRPQQRRLRVPARLIGDKLLQRAEQLRIALGQRLAAPARPTHPPAREMLAITHLTHPTGNRHRRQASRTDHCRLTARTMRERLRASPQTPLTLVELASHRPVTLPDRMLIDHEPGVLHNQPDSSALFIDASLGPVDQ